MAEDPDIYDKALERIGRRIVGEENRKQEETGNQADRRHVCSERGEKKGYVKTVKLEGGGIKKTCINCVRKYATTGKPDEKMNGVGSGDWKCIKCEEMNDVREEACRTCGDKRHHKYAKVGPAERGGSIMDKRVADGQGEPSDEVGERSKVRRKVCRSIEGVMSRQVSLVRSD